MDSQRIWNRQAVSYNGVPMKRLLIALFLVLIPLSSWAGGDIYVATTGNDTTGNGSISTPYATIAKAITAIALP